MSLGDQVPDGATVLVDTNPIIYVLEGSPLAAPFRSLFEAVDDGRIRALVTPITVAEVVWTTRKHAKKPLPSVIGAPLPKARGGAPVTSMPTSPCSRPACACVMA